MRSRSRSRNPRIPVICGSSAELWQIIKPLESDLPIQACEQEIKGETCIHLGHSSTNEVVVRWPNQDLRRSLEQAILYVRARRSLNE